MTDLTHMNGHGAVDRLHLDDLARALSPVVLVVAEEGGPANSLDAVLAAAIAAVPGAQDASITAITRPVNITTRAASSARSRLVDQAQRDAGEGPCLDALFNSATARIGCLSSETRWPQFARRAQRLGLGSMLAVQVLSRHHEITALTLVSDEPEAFGEESEQAARLVAVTVAIALISAEKQEQLRSGLHTRDVIGQAMGIVMERYGLASEAAFGVLRRLSQHHNCKISDLAQEIVQSRQLPGSTGVT